MRESSCKYLEQKINWLSPLYSFPREDEGSPRQAILAQFCETDLNAFRKCMAENDFNENNCLETKGILDTCAASAFKKVNSDPQYIFWANLQFTRFQLYKV